MAVAAAGSVFRLLLVASLVFSHVILLNAVPVTRIGRFMHGDQAHQLSETVNDDDDEDTKVVNERMGLQLNDYPGSGANNRHTPSLPRPQLSGSSRGCIEC